MDDAECGEDTTVGIAEVLVVKLVIVCARTSNLCRASVHIRCSDRVPEELEERPCGQANARHNSCPPAAFLLEPQIKPFIDLFPGHLAIHSHPTHFVHVHHIMVIFIIVAIVLTIHTVAIIAYNRIIKRHFRTFFRLSRLARGIVRDEIAELSHLVLCVFVFFNYKRRLRNLS